MAEPSEKPQKTEDVGEPYVASSLDSGPLEEKEEEGRGNVYRTETEEQLEELSVERSPEEEGHQGDWCREVDSASPLKPVQEVDSVSPLKPVQEVDCTPPLKPVQEVDSTLPLKPIQEVDCTPSLKPIQEVDCTSPLKPVQEVDGAPQLKPVQEVDSTPPLKPVQEVDCTPSLKVVQEVDSTPAWKPIQEVDCTSPLKAVQEVDSTPLLKPLQGVACTPPLKAVQEVDFTPQLKPVQEKDIDDCIYHLKWIMWHDKKTPIVTQNENGPCPLIAISNILLLRGKIILSSAMEIITAKQLMDYIGHMILQNVPKNLTLPRQLNYEQNMHDAFAVLPRLHTGLDVNVKFTGVKDFEYTPECIIFDLLNIPLYHGWLVDPQCGETVMALGVLGYNQIVEKIIVNKCSSETDLVTEALIAEQFLERTASQLTYHGLCELNAAMGHDELAILFRNNHFSTILKKKVCGPVDEASSDLLGMSQESNELFQLVTDQGFLHEPRVVWETLSNIEGDGMFVDSHFVTVPPKAAGSYHAVGLDVSEDQQISHDYLVALSLQEEQKQQHESGEQAWQEFRQMQEITSDEQLALRLQEEEQRQAQSAVPVAAISRDHARPYAHAQPAAVDRNKKGSCNIL